MGQQVEASLKATVGTSLTEIGIVSLKNYQVQENVVDQVTVSVRVLAGGSALNAFQVSERAHRNAFWVATYNTGTNWTAIERNTKILNAGSATSVDPTTLAAGASLTFDMDQLRSTEGLRFEAQVASGTAIVEI